MLKGGGCGVAASPPLHTPLFPFRLSSYVLFIIIALTGGCNRLGVLYLIAINHVAVNFAFRLYLGRASSFVLMGELLCEKERSNPAG